MLSALLIGSLLAQTTSVERLAAAGRVWAAVKYFHPWLAWQPVDWDAALIRVAPQLLRAETREEYAAAIGAMLESLGDPATRVVERRRQPAPPGPLLRTTDDGTLILTIHPATLGRGPQARDALLQAARRLADARAVVFDLRRHGDWSDRDPAAIGLAFLGGLNHELQFVALKAPGHRSRMYSGLPASAPGGSMFYHSAYYVRDGAALEARRGVRRKAVVFLVDESSCLPPIAAALHAAGQARIVAQGGASDACLVERYTMDLPEGLEVRLRVSELVYDDGTTGITPDLIVSADEPEQALEAALDVARRPQTASASRVKLPPYATPPAERVYAAPEYPPPELRLLAAFRIWSAFRYFFAYRELMSEDWDRVFEKCLPGLLRAADARQYALAVAELVAHSGDSHAAVESRALAQYFGTATVAVRTRMIEGRPVITQILDDAAVRRAGLAVGDVVLEVDGEAAEVRRERLGRYLAASTPQSLDHLVMQRWMNGAPGSEAILKVRDAGGQVRVVRLRRSTAYQGRPWRSCPVIQILAEEIGYVDLERLPPERVEEMFERLRGTRAIIFDLRGYPQGTAWRIAPRLTDRRQVPAALFRRPLGFFAEGRSGDTQTLGAGWDFLQYLPESDGWKYRGQTIALIDERAMSQAEHAGLFLRAANGTAFIGSRTAGANGDVARFTIPGGISIAFSGQQVRHPNGAPLQRVGLIPDLEVKPTVAGIRAGRDEVLEKALEYLGARQIRVSQAGEAR